MSTFSMFRRPVSIALALTASIAIVSCGDKTAPSPVSSVSVTTSPVVSTTSPLTVGGTAQATATVKATAGTASTVTWTSTTPAVATVSNSGLIKAVAPGTTDIIATSTADKTITGKVTITVRAATSTTPVVTGVVLTLTPATAVEGGTAKATTVVTGTNNSQNVTYTSSNTDVATVDASGTIVAKKAGTTEIKAAAGDDSSKSDTKTFTVTATGGGTTLTTAKINFAPTGAPTVSGYTTNTGAAYDTLSMIGWITEASVGATPAPLDVTANARNRGVSNGVTDPRLYTQVNMQCGNQLTGNPCAGGVLTSAAFQYKVVNGTYDVTVGVGEASNDVNSIMQINFESKTPNFVNAVNKFVSGPTARNLIVTKTVTVADGMLTVDAIGGNNTKINFLEIAPTPVK